MITELSSLIVGFYAGMNDNIESLTTTAKIAPTMITYVLTYGNEYLTSKNHRTATQEATYQSSRALFCTATGYCLGRIIR